MDKNYNKLISFIIALSVYILLILLIILYLKDSDIKKYNFKKNETVVQIDLISLQTKDNKLLNKVIPHKAEKKKKSLSKDNKIKSNLKSLFANVKTSSVKKVDKNVLNVKENKTKSRFKSKYKNQTKVKDIKISKISNVKKIKKSQKIITKSNEIVDEYYSNIKEIILKRWYEKPLYITDSYLVKVYVTINNNGDFSYNIIKYSGKIQLDNLITKFLDEQTKIKYPVSSDNKEKTILINFMNEKG